LGKTVTIQFLAFMRETLRFSTVEELKAQIARDISAAKEYHLKAGRRA
jgi:FAD synthase